MILRQKILINLIHRAGGTTSRLQLVKWMFLLAQDAQAHNSAAHYQFVPYKFGPFSFTMYQEIDALLRQGELTAVSDTDLKVSKPRFLAPRVDEPALDRDIERCWQNYGQLSTTVLLDTVYRRFPWFTLNADQTDRRKVKRTVAACAVYTAGYEKMQVDGFLNLLLQSGICRLVDVRNNPVSRRYGFHKSTLASLCERLDIEYCHEPGVGIPSGWRCDLHTQADYDRLFGRYVKDVLPKQVNVIHRIAGWVASTPSVLVCQEEQPASCHRSHLAKQVARISKLEVRDLRVAA
jgi:uncharacterized phage-associated protein